MRRGAHVAGVLAALLAADTVVHSGRHRQQRKRSSDLTRDERADRKRRRKQAKRARVDQGMRARGKR